MIEIEIKIKIIEQNRMEGTCNNSVHKICKTKKLEEKKQIPSA